MSKFQKQAADYDSWFNRHPILFQAELAAISSLLPTFQKAVEIGVGTGRFASALGIRHGLEPLEDYAEIARSRGIEVVKGIAEQMPYTDGSFDLALMVTVDCFLNDVPQAFAEAHRILQPGGNFVVAILDKNGAFAKKYELSGSSSYQNAHFHSPDEIVEWMTEAGFSDFRFAQTLLEEKTLVAEMPKTGVGEGSFAVIAGRKERSEKHPNLSVRELEAGDIDHLVRYWLDADAGFMRGMGVDMAKMPDENQWRGMLSAQLGQPYREKQSYCLIWQVDGRPVGHSNVNKIVFGEEAYMHLHLWDAEVRKLGYGATLVKMTLPYFFNNLRLKKLYCEPYSLNPAPNRTLEKIGFEFVKEYVTTPGWINFEQPVRLWELSYERFLAMNDA